MRPKSRRSCQWVAFHPGLGHCHALWRELSEAGRIYLTKGEVVAVSTRTALLVIATGLLGLLAVNAGDRFLKVLTRYRLVSFVWRVSRTAIFAAWSSAFLLLAAGASS